MSAIAKLRASRRTPDQPFKHLSSIEGRVCLAANIEERKGNNSLRFVAGLVSLQPSNISLGTQLMAKSPSNKPSAPSRIRFVMVEAEIGDGDLGQITQAIQNALRPSVPSSPQRKLAAPAPPQGGKPVRDLFEEQTQDDEVQEADFEEEQEETDSKSAQKPRTPRKPPPKPAIVQIDMHAPVSFADYIKDKDTNTQVKKYMVAAAWMHEHRSTPGVTPNHVYTIFRSAGWPTGQADFGQPLRNLKQRQFFTLNENSEYEINHIGLDFVRKLGE